MRRVRILRKAAKEAIEVAAWYERQHPGLGLEFDHAVNAAFHLLELVGKCQDIVYRNKCQDIVNKALSFSVNPVNGIH